MAFRLPCMGLPVAGHDSGLNPSTSPVGCNMCSEHHEGSYCEETMTALLVDHSDVQFGLLRDYIADSSATCRSYYPRAGGSIKWRSTRHKQLRNS